MRGSGRAGFLGGRRSLILCLAFLCHAACNAKGPTESFLGPDGLTPEERDVLLARVKAEMGRTFDAMSRKVNPRCSGSPCPVDVHFDLDGDCTMQTPHNWSVSVSLHGLVTGDPRSWYRGTAELDARAEGTNCQLGAGGSTHLVATTVLQMRGGVHIGYGDGAAFDVTLGPGDRVSMVGEAQWVSPRFVSGTCRVDLQFSYSPYAVTGSLCGSKVDES